MNVYKNRNFSMALVFPLNKRDFISNVLCGLKIILLATLGGENVVNF